MADTITDVGQAVLTSPTVSQVASGHFNLLSPVMFMENDNYFSSLLNTFPVYNKDSAMSRLIPWFAGGIVLFAVGLIMVLVSSVIQAEALVSGGAILLAIGSAIVAITLLRGQDINERTL